MRLVEQPDPEIVPRVHSPSGRILEDRALLEMVFVLRATQNAVGIVPFARRKKKVEIPHCELEGTVYILDTERDGQIYIKLLLPSGNLKVICIWNITDLKDPNDFFLYIQRRIKTIEELRGVMNELEIPFLEREI